MTSRTFKTICALPALILVSAIAAAPAHADPVGVGVLERMDVTVMQGGNTLFSFQNIVTTGKIDGTTPIVLGTAANGTEVLLTVRVDKPATLLELDRNLWLTINGKDPLSGTAANLFSPLDDGEITVRIENMVFSGTDAINRVAPWHPDEYTFAPENRFFYMLNSNEGFINLPASERYAPDQPAPYNDAQPSVQVPKVEWTANGYGFARLDNGLKTGFELSGIPDFGGDATNPALTITPVPASPPPYLAAGTAPINAGFADEIGITLNMRSYQIPEPVTCGLFLLGLLPLRRRIRR